MSPASAVSPRVSEDALKERAGNARLLTPVAYRGRGHTQEGQLEAGGHTRCPLRGFPSQHTGERGGRPHCSPPSTPSPRPRGPSGRVPSERVRGTHTVTKRSGTRPRSQRPADGGCTFSSGRQPHARSTTRTLESTSRPNRGFHCAPHQHRCGHMPTPPLPVSLTPGV